MKTFCKRFSLRFAVPALLSKLLYPELKSLNIKRRIRLFKRSSLSKSCLLEKCHNRNWQLLSKEKQKKLNSRTLELSLANSPDNPRVYSTIKLWTPDFRGVIVQVKYVLCTTLLERERPDTWMKAGSFVDWHFAETWLNIKPASFPTWLTFFREHMVRWTTCFTPSKFVSMDINTKSIKQGPRTERKGLGGGGGFSPPTFLQK